MGSFTAVIDFNHYSHGVSFGVSLRENSNTFNVEYFFKRPSEMNNSHAEWFKLNIVGMMGVTCMLK